MKASKILKFTGFTLLRVALIILVLFITMYLWNWLIPGLFHGPILTFWQTAGLIVLSKIFFSGIIPGHGGGKHYDRAHGGFHDEVRPSREEWWKRFNETKGHGNSQNGERPNREAWRKKVDETEKDKDSSSTAV